jgi:hypothetical protein
MTLISLIEAAVEHDEAAAPPRLHLGGSSIGRPCNRELWYSFRWAATSSFEGRMLRLFARGKREEDVFIRLLQRVGVRVDHTQYKISDVEGHFGGSLDAIVSCLPGFDVDVEAVLETKTANERRFQQMKHLGVEQTEPQYFAQMQAYMHGSGRLLSLFMVVNKNTDELHAEWVPYKAAVGIDLINRARFIIYTPSPPNRISNSASWYQCRDCVFRPQCHFAEPMRKSCRTCQFSAPSYDGQWVCRRNQNSIIPLDFMIKGCDDYKEIHD